MEKLSYFDGVKDYADKTNPLNSQMLNTIREYIYVNLKKEFMNHRNVSIYYPENKTEIEAMKNAHKLAGVAVLKSFRRLFKAFEIGKMFTEKEYADILFEEYSKLENFSDLIHNFFAESRLLLPYSWWRPTNS